MHVLIVSSVFPPEPVTSAVTSEQLAVGLVEAGHNVTVISAFPSKPGGRLYAGHSRDLRRVAVTEAGYKLIRTFSLVSPKPTAAGRFLENLSFGITSTLNALSVKPDVIYANTWPIFASGLLAVLCSARNLPLVLNIQDIHPEAAVGLGKLPSRGPIPLFLKHIDGLVARRSAALVTLSENFVEFYHTIRKVPRDKIHLVYNWMDDDEVKPGPRIGTFREMHDISVDSFVVMYAGNVGANAGVESVIEAAAKLQDVTNVIFVIAGDGSHRATCEALAHRYGLSNVRFFYPLRRDQVPDAQAAADLMILPTHRSGALTSVPSKLVAYMLSGRPVLAAVDEDSDTARIVRDARCGICVQPEDPEAMAVQIRKLLQVPGELAQMGERARSYAQRKFSRKACVPGLIRILESVAGLHSRKSLHL